MRKMLKGITALTMVSGMLGALPLQSCTAVDANVSRDAIVYGIEGAGARTTAKMKANPLISRNVPAFSAEGSAYGGNDEHYFTFWSSPTPNYIAYDLSEVDPELRKQVIAVWYNISSYDVIGAYASENAKPVNYTIELNKAPGGEYPADGWEVVETVENNVTASRQHLITMEGYNWLRLSVSDAKGGQVSINFDVHSASDGVSDSWIFFGDSITAGGMNNCYGTGYATYVNQLDSDYFPIQENGGIGGIRSIEGRENIDRWLEGSPVKYVSIAYGTNDAWGNPGNTEAYYENTKYMIDAILAAGKVPVLPKIPGSTNPDVGENVPLYNAKVEQLYEEYGDKLVKGPDFETFFNENPDHLSGDGVHPSESGYDAMRQLWSETMYETVYTAASEDEHPTTEPTTAPTSEITSVSTNISGDANCDGIITIADATAILQSIVNPKKYGLSDDGALNADCCDKGDGVTTLDALAVQMYDAGKITQLPVDSSELN